MSEKKLDIKGAIFSFAGTFTTMTHAQLEERLLAKGAHITRNPSAKTDFMVAGTDPAGVHYTSALGLGIPVVSEHQILAALRGESVFIDLLEEGGSEDANALFGEVRGMLHGQAPSAKLWQELTQVLDRCPIVRQEALASYIDDFFSKWRADGEMKNLVGYPLDLDSVRHQRVVGGYWNYGVPGELRVAPEAWVGELSQGVDAPKLALVRAIDLVWANTNGRTISKLLEHPRLTALDTLHLPLGKPLTRQLIQTLCKSPTLEKIKCLMVGDLLERTGAWFLEAGNFPSALERFDVTQYHAHLTWEFLQAPYFDNLTSLALNRVHIEPFLETTPRFPEHMVLRDPSGEQIEAMLSHQGVANHSRRFTTNNLSLEHWQELFALDVDVDLELLEVTPSSSHLPWFIERESGFIQEIILESPLLRRVEQLSLGPLGELLDRDALTRAHPHLTLLTT